MEPERCLKRIVLYGTREMPQKIETHLCILKIPLSMELPYISSTANSLSTLPVLFGITG